MVPELTELETKVLTMSAVPTRQEDMAEQLGLEVWEVNRLLSEVWSKVGVRNVSEARARVQELRLTS